MFNLECFILYILQYVTTRGSFRCLFLCMFAVLNSRTKTKKKIYVEGINEKVYERFYIFLFYKKKVTETIWNCVSFIHSIRFSNPITRLK